MSTSDLSPVAVYCGSSIGTDPAFREAAESVGIVLAQRSRPLIYGGGSKGIMGVVSLAVLEGGGKVTGIVPFAMVAAGGEGSRSTEPVTNGLDTKSVKVEVNEKGRERVESIVVESMHERKVEMAKRAGGFIALPGGFGTFEEVFEAITWTQIGIHDKPVVIVNVSGFYDPLKQMINAAIEAGYISEKNRNLVTFVDADDSSQYSSKGKFDWGSAAVDALDEWRVKNAGKPGIFDWTKKSDGSRASDNFGSS